MEKRHPKRTALRHKGGREHLNPVPLEPPLGYRREPSLAEQIRQQIRLEKLRQWEAEFEEETEEEADDFHVEDEFEPMSPHENDHVPTIAELKKQAVEINEKIKQEQRRKAVEDYKREKGEVPEPRRSTRNAEVSEESD